MGFLFFFFVFFLFLLFFIFIFVLLLLHNGNLEESGGSLSPCRVTVLPRHLWTAQYTVHMAEPWTLLQHVYVIVVGDPAHIMALRLTPLGEHGGVEPTHCYKSGRGLFILALFCLYGYRRVIWNCGNL